MKCDIGDIVFVNSYTYPDGSKGNYHIFVIMDISNDEITAIPIECLGFIVSSQIDKNNNVNPKYPYNEPINPNNENRLPKKSHVKCDELFSINPDNVFFVLGKITDTEYSKYIDLYKESLENK